MILLKLGGSLITDKSRPHTPLADVITRLAGEIFAAWTSSPGMRLVIGHGSGSFGHVPGKLYGTRQGVHSPVEWRGFSEVWWEARQLNELVVSALVEAGLPAIALPVSASLITENRQIVRWETGPLQAALDANLLPVLAGDVVFDKRLGGTILSTEEIFILLSKCIRPERVLLAGVEMGVWQDFPSRDRLVSDITPSNFSALSAVLKGSEATDVTGGMVAKVRAMLDFVGSVPGLEVHIFSGREPRNVYDALMGGRPGTTVHLD